jgi:thymidylate kinase
VVALSYVLYYRLTQIRHGGRGRVVIFDRYVADAAAQIRYFYGEAGDLRPQTWLLGTLSPKPLRSYLLEVRAEAALERKQEQFDLQQLKRQAELLREEADRFGVTRLEGEQPAEQLFETMLAEICTSLS